MVERRMNTAVSIALILMSRHAGNAALAFAGLQSAQRPSAFLSTRPSQVSSSSLVMIIDGREGRNGINGASAANSTATSATALRYTNGVHVEPAPLPPQVEVPRKPKKKVKTSGPAKFYPHRQNLLSALSMLPKVARAKGSYLYLEDGTPILDCLAQYGAVPLGHNNQEINEAVIDYLASNQAAFIQPFMPETAKELSHKLCELANNEMQDISRSNKYDYVVYSNSGAETVEAAIKLARTKTKRSKILSATDSFHGKSFAALSATGSDRYSNEFIVCGKNFDKVPLNDIEALAVALASKEYAAFMVEPVQGEGGMIPANKEYLQKAQELCAMTGTKLIFDEIQTGLGRTGTMFAKDDIGVHPDIILLSKALGGGIYPIGAMITKRSAYCNEFDRKHSSTFAAGGVASAAALETLELLETTDVMYNVRQQSKHVEIGLSRLQEKFPDILSFTGKGLMWSLDFVEPEKDQVGNHLSQNLWDTALNYIISGYLLNEKQLLCTPLMAKTGALRFEPPLTINQAEVSYFLEAIEEVCTILKNQRHDILLSYVIQRPTWEEDIHERFEQKHLNNDPGPPLKEGETRRKFAFLIHALGLDDTIKQLPPAIRNYFSCEDKKKMAEWLIMAGALEPEAGATLEVNMTSATGETVTAVLIGCPLSPRDMMKLNKAEKEELMASYHQAAKNVGIDHIIGLGAFTSVITKAGTQFVNTDEQLYTSGNSFTALASAESLKMHASARGDMGNMGVTVIGARGSVGRVALMELLQHFGHVNIIGNPRSGVEAMEKEVSECLRELIESGYGDSCDSSSSLGQMVALLGSKKKLDEDGSCLVERLRELAASQDLDLPITISTDANSTSVVDTTNYVLTATNEGKPFLVANRFLPGTVVFDLARPFDFEATPESNIEVFEGGLANMPEKKVWGDCNMAHVPAGQGLACLSETIALAMEGVDKSYSLGNRIPFTEAKEVYNICIKHGFSPLSYGGSVEPKAPEPTTTA